MNVYRTLSLLSLLRKKGRRVSARRRKVAQRRKLTQMSQWEGVWDWAQLRR